jgi:hypothetical protein
VLTLDTATVALLVRATARISFLLFLVGFAAPAAARAFAGAAWLQGQHKPALRALPVAHAIHYGFVLWLGALTEYANLHARAEGSTEWAPTALGMVALAVMIGLALSTYSGAAGRALQGARIATWGGGFIWLLFAAAYTPRAAQEWFYLPFAVAAWGALLLRLRYRPRGGASPGA